MKLRKTDTGSYVGFSDDVEVHVWKSRDRSWNLRVGFGDQRVVAKGFASMASAKNSIPQGVELYKSRLKTMEDML